MDIREVIIPPKILEKLEWKHHVKEHEVREVLAGNPIFQCRFDFAWNCKIKTSIGQKKGTSRARMFILLLDKPMLGDI